MSTLTRNVSQMQKLDRWVGVPLCGLLTALGPVVRFFGLASKPPRPGLLFIKLAEQGSTVLAAEAVAEAAREFSVENIYFLVFAENREILDILGWLRPENIIAIETESFSRMLYSAAAAVRRLRKLRLGTSIDLEFFARATAVLSFLTGCRRRVGFTAYPGSGPYRGRLLTDGVLYNPHLHTSAAFLSLVLAARLSPPLPALPFVLRPAHPELPSFIPTRSELDSIRSHLEGFGGGGPVILLNANAGDLLPLRRWATENYRALAGRILAEWSDVRIILTGNAGERPAIELLWAQIASERCRSLAGRTTLRELLALYGLSEILVTNDSGPAHFASLTRIDCITLFGPETPKLFAAAGPRSHALYAGLACSPCVNAFNNRQTECRNNLCLQAISVEMVLTKVREIYRRRVPTMRESVAH